MAKLLELSEIKISNFLSIKEEISIPIEKYNNSYINIFVGKNDSGKSNLLKALSYLKKDKETVKYTQLCHKDYKNNNNVCIDLYFTFNVNDNAKFIKLLNLKDLSLPLSKST